MYFFKLFHLVGRKKPGECGEGMWHHPKKWRKPSPPTESKANRTPKRNKSWDRPEIWKLFFYFCYFFLETPPAPPPPPMPTPSFSPLARGFVHFSSFFVSFFLKKVTPHHQFPTWHFPPRTPTGDLLGFVGKGEMEAKSAAGEFLQLWVIRGEKSGRRK